MKISFTGTHGIGKTTLATWLSELLDMPYIPEFAREFLESGVKINTPESFIKFEIEIYNTKLQYEKDALKKSDSFISDRSYIDYAVYLKNGLARFPYKDIKDLIYEEKEISCFFNDYESNCRDHNRIYDLIFFVTPFTEYISSEFDYREKNPFATNIIQDLLYNEYRNEIENGKVVIIKDKDLFERQKLIVRTLKERSLLSWHNLYINAEL